MGTVLRGQIWSYHDLTLRLNHAVWMSKHLVNQRLAWQWQSLTTVIDLSFGYKDSSTNYAALSEANVLYHMYAPGEWLHRVQIQQKITEFRTNVFLKINFLLKKKKEISCWRTKLWNQTVSGRQLKLGFPPNPLKKKKFFFFFIKEEHSLHTWLSAFQTTANSKLLEIKST